MGDVTHILSAIAEGDPHAAAQLLLLVYDELRQLAAERLAQERPGQTLQATALVHEAYLRLVDVDRARHWDSRAHFFAAAAEAMRRILVKNARRRMRKKRGGEWARVDLDAVAPSLDEDLLDLDDALTRPAEADPAAQGGAPVDGKGRYSAWDRPRCRGRPPHGAHACGGPNPPCAP